MEKTKKEYFMKVIEENSFDNNGTELVEERRKSY